MAYTKQKEDWQDNVDTITAANLEAWEQAIYDLKTNALDITNFGASTGAVDNSAAVQDAIDAAEDAGGGRVFFPPGEWDFQGPLVLPTPGPYVQLVGAGQDISVLRWTDDLGLGEFALAGADATGDPRNRIGIYHLSLWGPDPDGSAPAGTSPADMDGFAMGPRFVAHDCRVTGFRSGLIIRGDHCSLTNIRSQGNYYGLYFHGASQFDDHYIADFDFTSNKFASIAVGPGTDRLGGSTLIGGHLGFNPFCFYKEGSHTSENFIGSNKFVDVAFEGYGNAIIYDEDKACQVTGNLWIGCDETGGMSPAPYEFTDYDQDYPVRCSFWSNNHIVGGTGFQNPGDAGFFDVDNWVRTEWHNAEIAVAALNSGLEFVTGFCEKNVIYIDSEVTCHVIEAGSVAKYDVLAHTGGAGARKWVNGFDTIVSGVAQHATPAGGNCIYAVTGPTTINASGAIAALAYVKAGGADGKVVSDGTAKTVNSIGFATSAASAGQVAVILQGVT